MDESWKAEGNCAKDRSLGPDDFFLEGRYQARSPEWREAVERAAAICATCPVRQRCLDYANATNQSDGIWGGLTHEQRHARRYPRKRVNGRLVRVKDAGAA